MADPLVEVIVWQMAMDEKTRGPIVILQEKNGTAKLPIWIGSAEASAIATEVQGREFQRPLTHDLLATTIRSLGALVTRIEIASLKDKTYFARVVLQRGDQLVAIDARPSDSIALAVRMKAPIFVSPTLLTHELDDVLPDEHMGPPKSEPPTEQERTERIRRRIEGIDPEDFGRFSI